MARRQRLVRVALAQLVAVKEYRLKFFAILIFQDTILTYKACNKLSITTNFTSIINCFLFPSSYANSLYQRNGFAVKVFQVQFCFKWMLGFLGGAFFFFRFHSLKIKSLYPQLSLASWRQQ